mgnify:CR=1 FL=1
MELILASSSPRRRALLAATGCPFRIIEPDIEELSDSPLSPAELCSANAALKAEAVSQRFPKALVLGADTIVTLDGRIFGKPTDLEDARRMLAALSGRTHEVLTAIALRGPGIHRALVEHTRVTFREMDESSRNAYLGRIHPLDKAGAYSAQEDHGELIAAIEGCFQNVIGLPVPRLLQELTALRKNGNLGLSN